MSRSIIEVPGEGYRMVPCKAIQEERIAWSNLSLEWVMRGMEGEDSDYSMTDIREAFHAP